MEKIIKQLSVMVQRAYWAGGITEHCGSDFDSEGCDECRSYDFCKMVDEFDTMMVDAFDQETGSNVTVAGLDIMTNSLAERIKQKKRALFYKLRDLGSTLGFSQENLAETLDDPTEYQLSPLGIIQGVGSEIDIACGRLGEMVSLYKQLKELQEDALDKAIAEVEEA